MNKKINEILVFALLILLFIIVTVYTSSDRGLNFPPYTVFSTEKNGSSLIYDTLKHMGYNVDISYEFVNENTTIENIQVIINPSAFYTSYENMERLASWVERGGILIFTNNGLPGLGDYFVNQINSEDHAYFGRGFIYYFGAGRAYTLDSMYLTNADLMANGSLTGASITEFIDMFSHNKIYFNESYHGYSYSETFWEMLPFNFRLSVYQVIIVIAAVVYYLGKRFGKAVPYYEEIEREENEYVPALANLYMHLGMGNIVTDTFKEQFLLKASDYFKIHEPDLKTIYECWKTFNLPYIEKLAYIMTEQNKKMNTKRPKGKYELNKQYKYLMELTSIVSKKE